MADGGTLNTQPGYEIVTTLHERVDLVAQLRDPEITLARAVATYLLYKRKRLSEDSERGYTAILQLLTKETPKAKLADLEPPDGGLILEEFLASHWSSSAPRTYNKSRSVLSDFTKWHVARGTLHRDPMATIERAKTRPIHRRTFTDAEVVQILAANTRPRDQIALRLLLFFGLRKGALRRIQFEHFNVERHELTIFTKGGKIQTIELVDPTIWDLLDELREPAHHYLLPQRTTRRRTPPQKKALAELGQAFAAVREAIERAAQDPQCADELAGVLDSVVIGEARLALAVGAASTQARIDPTEQIGQHGLHLLWYRWLARGGVVAEGATAGRRMHLARHTSIQRVLDKTGNMRAAQQLAGHSSIATTGDNYTEYTPKQLAATMRDVLA